MKRKVDPCQTGWDSLDDPDIGLLTLYHSICHNSDSRQFTYRPHHLPLKTQPTEYDQQQQQQSKLSPKYGQKESKFIFNRKNFRDRMKRYLINQQKEKHFCESSLEKERTLQKKNQQKLIKLQQFNFMQRTIYHNSVADSRKSEMKCSGVECRNAKKRLCIKEELEKIIKNRRKQAKQKNQLETIDKSERGKRKRRKNNSLLQIQRYSTLDPHSQKDDSKDSLKIDNKKRNMYLDCTIVNLSKQNQIMKQQFFKKRYSPHNNYSYRQKTIKSQMKRYEPPSFRQKMKFRQIYRSNLLRQFQNVSPTAHYCQFKEITPQKNSIKLKQIIRSHLNRKINAKTDQQRKDRSQ